MFARPSGAGGTLYFTNATVFDQHDHPIRQGHGEPLVGDI